MASSNYKGRPEGNSRLPQNNGHHDDDRQEGDGERNGTRDKPAAEFIFGRIRVVVWKNTSKEGDWYSSSLSRSYYDEADKKWKTAATLGKDDLLTGCEALRAAYLFIVKQHGGKVE